MLVTTVIVKIISAIYKIPLTAFIGAVGRGYFAYAYNICMPIHAITMGVFPIALSKLVSTYHSKKNVKMVDSLSKASVRLFSLIGFIGMAIIIVCAKPYSSLIVHSEKSIYTILVLAPSVLFSCMAASYRGYYEGFMNMVPTAVSQTIEAVFKLVFGLLFAKYSMAYLYQEYVTSGTVLNHSAASDEEALSFIYPLTSAAAMLGVTLGAVFSLAFLCLYKKINSKNLIVGRQDIKDAKRLILSFSFPIMISSAVQSVFQFLDTASIQMALNHVESSVLFSAYESSLHLTSIAEEDLPSYLFGIFSASLDFKNLVPGVTMALGVCAVPAVSKAFESKNKEALTSITNSIFKYTALLSCLGGLVIAVSCEEILTVFYGSGSRDIVIGAKPLVLYFALSVPLYSLAGVAVFTVQAIGVPEKSILPFFVSGMIRVALNYLLITNDKLLLSGAVISGAAGYLLLTVWNIVIIVRCAKIKISLSDIVIKPLLVSMNTIVLFCFCQKALICSSNLYFILLFKTAILLVLYCILCICFGLIRFKEMFAYFKKKKMA